MSALDAPQAQAILNDAILDAEDIVGMIDNLLPFLQRYYPHFQRSEQRDNAFVIVQGKLSALSRKTAEPIAHAANRRRETLQDFLGSSPWEDDLLLTELRQHVREVWNDPNSVLIGDGSGFQKKGEHSCGVKRQYCGRLGKIENCQIGIFLGYSCKHGHTLLDHRLFLPHEWADHDDQRQRGKIPEHITYQEGWEILLDQLRRSKDVPHAWFVCDSEFGKVYAFRQGLRRAEERYAVDVPNDFLIRDLGATPPERTSPHGRAPAVPFVSIEAWAAGQPAEAWQRFEIRGGEKGPLLVEAVELLAVETKEEGRVGGATERLVVIRTVGREDARTWYVFTNAEANVGLCDVVWAHGQRFWQEWCFQQCKSEVGMSHYEVRSWRGWHHHMTMTLLSMWYLGLEKDRLKKKLRR